MNLAPLALADARRVLHTAEHVATEDTDLAPSASGDAGITGETVDVDLQQRPRLAAGITHAHLLVENRFVCADPVPYVDGCLLPIRQRDIDSHQVLVLHARV